MKNKYGIGLFAIALILILLISCAYQYTFQLAKEREEKERKAEMAAEEYASVDGQALKADCYYLMEENGYIVVYLSDKKTAYEYTDISYDRLPANLRNEIRNGKYVGSQDELYGFLENYSS